MLAGDRAAHFNAQLQDAAGQGLRAFQRAGLAAIKQDERMEIAVASVKDVRYAQPCLVRHLADAAQCLAELAARHDAVLHNEVGREPAYGAESALAPLPDGQALLGVASGAHFDGLAGGDDGIQAGAISGHGFAGALQFDDQDGLAAGRIFGVDSGYCGLQGQGVHDLNSAGQQPAGDNR